LPLVWYFVQRFLQHKTGSGIYEPTATVLIHKWSVVSSTVLSAGQISTVKQRLIVEVSVDTTAGEVAVVERLNPFLHS